MKAVKKIPKYDENTRIPQTHNFVKKFVNEGHVKFLIDDVSHDRMNAHRGASWQLHDLVVLFNRANLTKVLL